MGEWKVLPRDVLPNMRYCLMKFGSHWNGAGALNCALPLGVSFTFFAFAFLIKCFKWMDLHHICSDLVYHTVPWNNLKLSRTNLSCRCDKVCVFPSFSFSLFLFLCLSLSISLYLSLFLSEMYNFQEVNRPAALIFKTLLIFIEPKKNPKVQIHKNVRGKPTYTPRSRWKHGRRYIFAIEKYTPG